MTDSEFLDRAESLLKTIEAECDRISEQTDTDLDCQRVGNMLTLTFANRSQIVINLQKPLHEVWMAAKSGGHHYRWVDGVWQDTKADTDFFAALSTDATLQAGCSLRFGG